MNEEQEQLLRDLKDQIEKQNRGLILLTQQLAILIEFQIEDNATDIEEELLHGDCPIGPDMYN